MLLVNRHVVEDVVTEKHSGVDGKTRQVGDGHRVNRQDLDTSDPVFPHYFLRLCRDRDD